MERMISHRLQAIERDMRAAVKALERIAKALEDQPQAIVVIQAGDFEGAEDLARELSERIPRRIPEAG